MFLPIISLKFRIELSIDLQKAFDTLNLATNEDFNVTLRCL